MRTIGLVVGTAVVFCSVGCERAEELGPPASAAPTKAVLTKSAEPTKAEPLKVAAPGVSPVAPGVSPIVPKPKPVAPKLVPPLVRELPLWPGGLPERPRAESTRWLAGLSRDQRQDVKQACKFYRADPCAGALRPFSASFPDPADKVLAQIGEDQKANLYEYCAHVNKGTPGCNTPLVVSFDDRPIEFHRGDEQVRTPNTVACEPDSGSERPILASGSTVSDRPMFAFEPGTPVATDWPTAATPWIAIDLDGDGAITSGRELFGDATLLPGGAKAANGFAALAALDANSDGVIDARDPAFASLLLWADTNGDRRSSPAELRPLSTVVVSIPLANHREVRCTSGDCEGERGAMVFRDGTAQRTGAIVDVYLRQR